MNHEPTLQSWCNTIHRGPLTWHSCGDPDTTHAHSSVWAGRDLNGICVAICKAFSSQRKFQQEVSAYQRWTPQLSNSTPELLAVHNQHPRAVLISVVPGEVDLHAAQSPLWYQQAGAWLRRLHTISHYDDDSMPLQQALLQRCERWTAQAHDRIDQIDQGTLDDLYADLKLTLAECDLHRVPCHRDFTPRNWVLNSDTGQLSVIDFEHARADCWLADIVRLYGEYWVERADLASAFWTGYGRNPTTHEFRLLDQLTALDAIATMAWAAEHHDETFYTRGQQLWTRYLTGRRTS